MKNENLLLTLAGFFTWAVVAYIEINTLLGSPYVWWVIISLMIFLVAFLSISCSYPKNLSVRSSQAILFLQVFNALALLLFCKGPVAPVLLVLWSAQLPYFFAQRSAMTMIALSMLLFYAIMIFLWDQSYPIITGLIYFGFQLFSLSSSFARVNERNAREHVEQLNQQLQATRILLAQSTRQDERVRIARDLHDILGHQLTALNLQLEILQHKVPDELRTNVQESKQLAKELLENIRQVVRDQRNLLSLDIRDAVQGLAAHTPDVEIDITGELKLDSVRLVEQLVLCIQEGMSNALRHGQATKLHLTLKQEADQITLLLDDNGKGMVNNENGSGLQGMRQRLKLYKGNVELSSTLQGCCLAISLNANPQDF